jgi:alkylhydroperoxidase family enzyme
MPANVFDVFMGQHPPLSGLVDHANRVLWDESALSVVVKERMRIALAEQIGCSYCARFRTDLDGEQILEDGESASAGEERKAQLAERFGVAVASGEATDELVVEMQAEFSEAEFSDLVFSVGWFIGMQHVGRLMHWDNSCPVAPIRELVEAGKAA